MSGDVQPRKRKDKKKKKDELSLEEPRGTAAALGEGDVFMHSYHEHGTGGHWCAKVIFFSLLAVLITLIGLIILENRGLSELEANAVESRYSGVLEGWLEDAPDDDHHDVHTLELKHHDDDNHHDRYDVYNLDDHEDGDHGDEDTHEDEIEDSHEDEHDHEDEDEDEDETGDQEDGDEDERNEQENEEQEQSEEQDVEREEDEEEDEDERYAQSLEDEEAEDDNEVDRNDQDDDDEQNEQGYDDEQNELTDELEDEDEPENSQEAADDEDEDEHEDEDEDDEVEIEKIEQEASEEEPISTELPVLPEEDDDEDSKDDDKGEADDSAEANDDDEDDDDDDDDDEFLEADDDVVVERITAPAGKPFVEVEEDNSSERPPDTLEEEEEYEKQQEELRREEEQSSHMWLKLSVGGALLAATHAVLRRATASSDEPNEERETREETPADRRMTLIPDESSTPVVAKKVQESAGIEEVVRKETPVFNAPPVVKQDSEEESEEPEEIEEEIEESEEPKRVPEKDKELLSDEEELEEEEEEIVVPKKEPPKFSAPPLPTPAPKVSAPPPEPEPDDEVPDDVEIIEDEQLEEELEEEDDEDDISDVDDAELLTRLEAKYGRLPEPDRPGQKHSNPSVLAYKDGGDSVEDSWPGEPSDPFWRDQLDSAEQDLRQGEWSSAIERAGSPQLRTSGRARYITAVALDRQAEAKRDNRILSRAIAAYLELLKMNENLTDKKLVETAIRTLDRIQFRGNYLNAEPVYRLLIRRFPNEPAYRNNLTISFLMANRADLAAEVLKETLVLWPDDRVALAHYAFVLKTHYNKHEEAIDLFEKALRGDKGPACEPRFYYHYGDALLLLGRYKEAHEVHKRGAKYGHFLSPAQRSLYNVPRLKGQPWWNVNDTPFTKLAEALEKSWKEILKEGEAAKALYEKEKEGLKERGDWSQMDLFVRGQEIPGRCKRAPITCAIVRSEPAAIGCRRGQIKFSAMAAGTHVRPHVGPTNCRLRMHLGLSNTKDTYIRVDKETRQWQEGKVLLFDDSFEHEVWHNGTGKRLVLIVDVWHPDLTAAEKRTLPAI